MKKIRASTFKAQCLNVMNRVQATGEPIIVTKRGTPIVKVVPAESSPELFGFMADQFDIVGDIEAPVVPLKQWKVTRR